MYTAEQFAEFEQAYRETAVWSSCTDGDHPEPLDAQGYTGDSFGEGGRDQSVEECREFLGKAGPLIEAAITTGDMMYWADWGPWGLAGHDFWLTRNHHGAGFWDGGWPEPYATQLTELAHRAGERHVWESDGELFFEPG